MFLSLLGHKTAALDLKVRFDQYDILVFDIVCNANERISLNKIASYKLTAKKISAIHVSYCMAMPFFHLFDTLGFTSNGTSKALYLKEIANLEANHLTGLDEYGIKTLKVLSIYQKSIQNFDLFSTVPKLEHLTLDVRNESFLPDRLALPQLKSLKLKMNSMPDEEDDFGKFGKYITIIGKNSQNN